MLPFRVIQIEQHRALHQNAAKVYLRDLRGSELPLIAGSLSGRKLSELNRQIPELEHPVTSSRKQTAETCSNRQKIQKRLRAISKSTSLLGFWSKSRSYRKQTIKPFLPRATTAYRETASSSNFQISARVLNYELQHHREALCSQFQSANLSRSYGRS